MDSKSKNIVIYWHKFKGKKEDIISFVGEKRQTYLELFESLSGNANVAIVFGINNYLGDLKFKNFYKYEKGNFIFSEKTITADAILDRSRGHLFPTNEPALQHKVLNSIDFKKLVDDKWNFYLKFKEYSPKTSLVNNESDLAEALSQFKKNEVLVIKPRFGMKGEGVIICKQNELDFNNVTYPAIVQEFIETKDNCKVKGITERHDLRTMIIDGKIVYAIVRMPQKDSYLANLAQGGKAIQVATHDLPAEIISATKKIAPTIKKEFNNPFYSIDFGFTKNGFIIFEMNNQVGFPNPKNDHKKFISKLTETLLEKSKF